MILKQRKDKRTRMAAIQERLDKKIIFDIYKQIPLI